MKRIISALFVLLLVSFAAVSAEAYPVRLYTRETVSAAPSRITRISLMLETDTSLSALGFTLSFPDEIALSDVKLLTPLEFMDFCDITENLRVYRAVPQL